MDWNKFSQTDIEVMVPRPILERGLSYFYQGQILKACRVGEMLAGVLIGTGGNYRVRLWFKESELQGDCTCPYDGFCKHMVALAAGWLENRSLFINLQPQLDQVLADQANMPDVLLKLVKKDPVLFLDLFIPTTSPSEFITTKGLLSLIRNTFSFPRITKNEVEQLWEQTIQVRQLILKALANNDPEAPLLFRELLLSLALILEEEQHDISNEFFNNLLTDLLKVSLGKPIAFLQPIVENLVELYFNPKLFQLTTSIRNTFITLTKNYPALISEFIQPKITIDLSPTQFMLIYELYAQLVEEDSGYQAELGKIIPVLTALSEGRLWLIDRLMDSNLEEVFNLAKEGLWLFPEDKSSYRERLIEIHIRRHEPRQAASLSFIQFQSKPNLAEYLRLKDILKNHPIDWQNYAKKVADLIINREEKLLAIEIAIAEQDHVVIKYHFDQIIEDETLLFAVTKRLSHEIPSGLSEIYPPLIQKLLSHEALANWGSVLELLAAYKKFCYQNRQKESWDLLREELSQLYGADARFQKKFGSLLIS